MTKKFTVSANGMTFGPYEAQDAQTARDACAVDAGYKSEADMTERLGRPSELVALELSLPLILNQPQAEAVYSAMCALNNVSSRCADIRIGDDAIVEEDFRGAVKVHGPDSTERYDSQSAFATAYGLQTGA